MTVQMQITVRAHALLGLLLLVSPGCGSDPVAGADSGSEPADVSDTTGAVDSTDRETVTIPEDTGEDVDGGRDSGDASETQPNGEPCGADEDCESGLCIFLAAGTDTGVCTEPCFGEGGCEEGFDCILLSNSGGDASRVCIPPDYCYDPDQDTFGVGPGCNGRDCDEENEGVNVGADEVCDGVDNDCDGEVDNSPRDSGLACDTGFDGICAAGVQECELGNLRCLGTSNPTDELCDGVDNDCDGEVDETTDATALWYADTDNDRYGDPEVSVRACAQPVGYVAQAGDCDDGVSAVNPTATELCDSIDNNCDGTIDEGTAANALTWYADVDEDQQGDAASSVRACSQPVGYVSDTRDCDDARDDVYAGAPESCDGVDNDCDGSTDEGEATDAPTWYADTDEDDYGDIDVLVVACAAPDGYVADSSDCNDDSDLIYPGAPERCNGADNNCDGDIDLGGSAEDAPLWYADTDEDGFGDALVSVQACSPPTGYVGNDDDCDDDSTPVNPDAVEVCDGVDNNCDDSIDPDTAFDAATWHRDADEDTWGNPDVFTRSCQQPAGYVARAGDCNDGQTAVNPDAVEICDRIDNDCDTVIDPPSSAGAPTWYLDDDGDTFGTLSDAVVACYAPPRRVNRAGDCNDALEQINPEAIEVCDGVDNNCDDSIDPPGSVGEARFYRDQDGDLYGNPSISQLACAQPAGYVTNTLDCNDNNNAINQDAVEICDGVDNNCDRSVDESLSRSCYGGPAGTSSIGSCRAGSQACSAGTWGSCVGEVRPATDNCDGQDNDCDGVVDNIVTATESTTYTVLNGAHDQCDGVVERFSSQCNAAIHRSCGTRECLVSGFGAVENDGNTAFVTCVPGTQATVRQLQWPALSALQPACNGTSEFFGLNCNSAIHRWCQNAGYAGGWGPVERDATNVFVTCAARSVDITTTFTALSALQPTCNASSGFSLDCNSAIHRTCQANGYSSGWGPVESSGNTAVISCLPLR
jgi:hypothetical protein